jgi:hypothetical protein
MESWFAAKPEAVLVATVSSGAGDYATAEYRVPVSHRKGDYVQEFRFP